MAKKVLLQASESLIDKGKNAYDLRRDIDTNPNRNEV